MAIRLGDYVADYVPAQLHQFERAALEFFNPRVEDIGGIDYLPARQWPMTRLEVSVAWTTSERRKGRKGRKGERRGRKKERKEEETPFLDFWKSER
jgi:hypothetical protein